MSIAELYATLHARKRPEDVADLILRVLPGEKPRALRQAAKHSLRRTWHGYTSMLEDFARPVGAHKQLTSAARVFETLRDLPADTADDPERLAEAVRAAGREIAKEYGANDYLGHRLNRARRSEAGLGQMSRRQYNKRFRALRHLEDKITRLARAQHLRKVTMTGKSGLATRLSYEEFAADTATACFVAYLTARANLRTEFTVTGHKRAYDSVARSLMEILRRNPDRTNWFAVAHVFPTTEVLGHLDDEQKGRLLGMWYGVLTEVGDLLESLWNKQRPDRSTMIVRPGDDSTTWNQAARAWTKAREGWFALLHAVGAEEILDRMCPGKVLLLVAADLAALHRQLGGGLHPDTPVWAELPLPWQVLRGEAECPRSLVEEVCARHGLDPAATGWTAPRPDPQHAVPFEPTPELVHGVAVSDPLLATLLRSAGVFSGKKKPAATKAATRTGENPSHGDPRKTG
ncbi:hypothetical protein [Thermobifida cellulosilytica]|uniref:hypothetical protein n=1 Tax=Thermobifida cellulosilytica TaxID=144786 RepID=UPI000AD73EE2|nr:hypothetical protein [Thermobifida cellulosilytica]